MDKYRIPKITDQIRLRKSDAVAYDPASSTIFEFNDAADKIIRLVDGTRDEFEIAFLCAQENQSVANEIFPKCRSFLEKCEGMGVIVWQVG